MMAMLMTPGTMGPGRPEASAISWLVKAVGHRIAPQFAEVDYVLVGGHQFHRANLVAQVNVFKEKDLFGPP